MAITDVSPEATQAPVKGGRRMRADTYVLIVGLVAVGLIGIARFVYEPTYQEKQQATQAFLLTEHTKVCEQLGITSGSDRDDCLKALDALYTIHQQAILADRNEI